MKESPPLEAMRRSKGIIREIRGKIREWCCGNQESMDKGAFSKGGEGMSGLSQSTHKQDGEELEQMEIQPDLSPSGMYIELVWPQGLTFGNLL